MPRRRRHPGRSERSREVYLERAARIIRLSETVEHELTAQTLIALARQYVELAEAEAHGDRDALWIGRD